MQFQFSFLKNTSISAVRQKIILVHFRARRKPKLTGQACSLVRGLYTFSWLADVAAKRAYWHEQLAVEPVAALVFVDESGASTKMTRLRGRALGGKRLRA